MDAIRGDLSGRRRGKRRWRFASAVFDEGRWALFVDGRPVPLEAKPLELLRALLLRADETVSKAQLLDAVWPDVSVVEGSLSTAMLKLRRALGDDDKASPIIETIPRIGYRIAVPVELEFLADAPATGEAPDEATPHAPRRRRWPFVAGAAALALAVGAMAVGRMFPAPWDVAAPSPGQMRDAADAIRRMDVPRIEQLLREGWDPSAPYDDQGNGALTMALNICEWDPAHDRHRLVLLVRTLIDGGARLDTHNVWGDTPYTIASARRYCGPDHPVTRMIGTMCYRAYPQTGSIPAGNVCARGPSTASPSQQRQANVSGP